MGWTDKELDAWVAEERRKDRRAARWEFWNSTTGQFILIASPILLVVLLTTMLAHFG